MRILVLTGALALGACGSEPAQENAAANITAAPTPPPSLMFGKVDLLKHVRAFGTEPYWIVDLAPGTIEFTDFSAEKPEPQPFYYVPPAIADGTARYTTRNRAGDAVVLTLTAEPCLEAGEEEDTQPLTAELRIGARTLRGCAGIRTFPGSAGNTSDEAGDNAAGNAAAP
jgi:uncharacterized membrane protein